MNSENTKPRSLAAKASWVSLALITGCVCAFVVFAMIDEAVGGFAQNRPGQFRNPCLRASVCIDLIASTLRPALCVSQERRRFIGQEILRGGITKPSRLFIFGKR